MTRSKNTEIRRAQITDALRRVMAREGYEGASIAKIAAEAGLTPGLVHYHFKNKLEILLSLLGIIIGWQEKRIERLLAAVDSKPWRQLCALIDAHLAVGREQDPEMLACWIAMSGEALRNERVRGLYSKAEAKWLEGIQEVIHRGIQAGSMETVDPPAAAAALLAVIQGYYVVSGTSRSLIPRGTAARSAKAMAKGLLLQQGGLSPLVGDPSTMDESTIMKGG